MLYDIPFYLSITTKRKKESPGRLETSPKQNAAVQSLPKCSSSIAKDEHTDKPRRLVVTAFQQRSKNARRQESGNLRGLRESPRAAIGGVGASSVAALPALPEALFGDLRRRGSLPNRNLRRRPSETAGPLLGLYAQALPRVPHRPRLDLPPLRCLQTGPTFQHILIIAILLYRILFLILLCF